MSVNNFQGYAVDKPTSKVMAPPGGRSSNIFGYEEERKPANGSSNGSNGSQAHHNQHQLSPTKQTTAFEDAASNKKSQMLGNDLFGKNEAAAQTNRKKRTGYNPITGESYDDEPVVAKPAPVPEPVQNRPAAGQSSNNGGKQPPGGRSTGLW